MKSKIRVLTDHTINKIAAGEVIENPASVAKELVENALDAGATEICIEIKGGGRQLIRVTDNGCGMTPDDALLCLERHATSKIKEVEDLLTIGTMGFRGEAIPSIASISKFTLLTCPNPPASPEQMGTLVSVEGGKILNCSPAACAPGTTIEVKALFFNVPVRRKFQKSPAYDANEIQKMMTLLALGYPEVRFQLISNEKTVWQAKPPQSDSFEAVLGERISTVLGAEFFEELCPVQSEKDLCSLRGFVGLPTSHRQNRTSQYLFINKRGVYSPFVSYAVRDGYGPSLPPNRHPIYVLHLNLPGEWIDVNVHPQKKEVRLRQESFFKDMIVRAVEKTLQTHNPYSFSMDLPEVSNPAPWEFRPIPTSFEATFPSDPMPQHNIISQQAPMIRPKADKEMESPTLFQIQAPEATAKSLPIPKVITTLPGYIIVDPSSLESIKGSGLCLIDQHGAHARIIYEKLKSLEKNREVQGPASQLLLIPYTFESSFSETELLLEHLPYLNEMGISIREFGQNTFSVDAIPQYFGNMDLQELIKNIISSLLNSETTRLETERTRTIALAASRAAALRNKKMSSEEAQALLKQLMQCQVPFQCPHGQPTLAQIPFEELARYFKGASAKGFA